MREEVSELYSCPPNSSSFIKVTMGSKESVPLSYMCISGSFLHPSHFDYKSLMVLRCCESLGKVSCWNIGLQPLGWERLGWHWYRLLAARVGNWATGRVKKVGKQWWESRSLGAVNKGARQGARMSLLPGRGWQGHGDRARQTFSFLRLLSQTLLLFHRRE